MHCSSLADLCRLIDQASKRPSASAALSEEQQQEAELTQLCNAFLKACVADGASGAASASTAAANALADLRKAILLKPMPSTAKSLTRCNIRGLVWQLLLGV